MEIKVYKEQEGDKIGAAYTIVIDEVEMIRVLRMLQNKVKTSGIIWE